ncbi:hypothetical protein Hanom_Chr15g01351021 [Helianthus anomalus]
MLKNITIIKFLHLSSDFFIITKLLLLFFIIEPRVSLDVASLFLRGRGKFVYILPSLDSTLALLLMRFIEYDDDDQKN